MLNLLETVRSVIERYVIGRQSLTESANAGDTTLYVASSRRYNAGDIIAVYSKPTPDAASLAELRTISAVPTPDAADSRHRIVIDSPVTQTYDAETSGVEKTVSGQFVDGIYLGDPARLPAFPSITIEAASKTSEGLTIGSDRRDFELEIMVYADGATYDAQYRAMLHYAEQIEESLFRSVIPLVKPYDLRTLAEPVNAGDTVIRLTESLSGATCAPVWLESPDRRLLNRIGEDLGNAVYSLIMPAGFDFNAGDSLIRPRRGFFDSRLTDVKYGSLTKDSATLQAARLRFQASEERIRMPFRDPLTS